MNRVCVNCRNIVPGENISFIRRLEPICKDCFHNVLGIIGHSGYAVSALAMCSGMYIRFNEMTWFLTAGDDGFLYVSRKQGSHQERIQSVSSLSIKPGFVEVTGA